MKAINVFSGSNSYGTSIEVAQGANDKWYIREYGYNGYGVSWSKWALLANFVPVHPTKIKVAVECADAPDYVEVSEQDSSDLLEFGFSLLRKSKGPNRYRLPD